MIIHDFQGRKGADTWDDIERILQLRYPPNNANCFYMAASDLEDAPLLVAYVVDDLATLWFTHASSEPGFVSQNMSNGPDTTMTFYENVTGERHEFPLDTVVAAKDLESCVREFQESNRLPTCVEWLELS